MSSTEIIKLIELLLDKVWTPDETILLKKLADNLVYYKSLIPKALKIDIVAILQIANTIKSDYDDLKLRLQNLETQIKHKQVFRRKSI